MSAPSALAGLYNSTSELSKRNTAKANIGDAGREQEVCTPGDLLAAIRSTWGKIALDPCHSPKSLVNAEQHYWVPARFRDAPTERSPDRVIAYYEADASLGEVDGLKAPWRDFTFVNPPYAHLDQWLPKAQSEGAVYEVAVLCPVRPSRVWWRAAKRSCERVGGGCFWLDPLAFVGNTSAFPQSLCVLYWGQLLDNFAHNLREFGELD